jgi:predicted lipoprotein with Yx(FWY)xxD motif
VALGALLVAPAAACGNSQGSTTPTTRTPQSANPKLPSYALSTRNVSGLGTIVVNGHGYTLYLFLPDNHSSKSTCTNLCAVAWPPLVLPTGVSASVAGPGINGALMGTTLRSDGSTQVTYNGWPLYLWPNDTGPGQASGQGLNNLGGLWYVVSPSGNPIR